MSLTDHTKADFLRQVNAHGHDVPELDCDRCFDNLIENDPVEALRQITYTTEPIRFARCAQGCLRIEPSSRDLAFFESRPNKEYDGFYCGCRGWN